MTDPDDREDGFYWISIDGQVAEVAQWQSEWGAWLVVGRVQPLTDELCLTLTVLSACLAPPPQPADGRQNGPTSSPDGYLTRSATITLASSF